MAADVGQTVQKGLHILHISGILTELCVELTGVAIEYLARPVGKKEATKAQIFIWQKKFKMAEKGELLRVLPQSQNRMSKDGCGSRCRTIGPKRAPFFTHIHFLPGKGPI